VLSAILKQSGKSVGFAAVLKSSRRNRLKLVDLKSPKSNPMVPSKDFNMHSTLRLPWATSLLLLGLAFPSFASADEPYEQFLARLKDQRHIGVAEAYLDRLSSRKDLTPLFKAGLELER